MNNLLLTVVSATTLGVMALMPVAAHAGMGGVTDQIATLDASATRLIDEVTTNYPTAKTGAAGSEADVVLSNINLGTSKPDLISATAVSADGVVQVLVANLAQVSGILNGLKLTFTPRVCTDSNQTDKSACSAAVKGMDVSLLWTCAVSTPLAINPITFTTADGVKPDYFANAAGILKKCAVVANLTVSAGVQSIS